MPTNANGISIVMPAGPNPVRPLRAPGRGGRSRVRSRCFQVRSRQVHVVLAESGRRVNECIGPLNPKLGRKPRPPQHPQLSPAWRGKDHVLPRDARPGRRARRPSAHRRRMGARRGARRFGSLVIPTCTPRGTPRRSSSESFHRSSAPGAPPDRQRSWVDSWPRRLFSRRRKLPLRNEDIAPRRARLTARLTESMVSAPAPGGTVMVR